jgi:hypothetical protein
LLDFATAEILRCRENGRAEGTLECGPPRRDAAFRSPSSPAQPAGVSRRLRRGFHAGVIPRRRQAAALQGAFGTFVSMAEASVSPSVAGSAGRQTPLRLFFPETGWNGKASPFGRSQTPQNGVRASPPLAIPF